MSEAFWFGAVVGFVAGNVSMLLFIGWGAWRDYTRQ